MTIQTYPKNFANLAVPEPPRGAILVNLADVEAMLAEYKRLLDAYRSDCSGRDHRSCRWIPDLNLTISGIDNRCPACKEYDKLKEEKP